MISAETDSFVFLRKKITPANAVKYTGNPLFWYIILEVKINSKTIIFNAVFFR